MHQWLLPEYIEDILPDQAMQIETWRRKLLDLFSTHGYDYVIPPTLEYLESLTTGVGRDLDLATFKVVDQLSGRLMGVRADITPQAARIDAHLLNQQGVTRLCYAGNVLRTLPDAVTLTREPIQIGAELYGHAGVEGDLEIQVLMIKALRLLGLKDIYIDFSHTGIFSNLLEISNLNQFLKKDLQESLQLKDASRVKNILQQCDAGAAFAIQSLMELNGDIGILDEAEKRLPKNQTIKNALTDLRIAAGTLKKLGVNVSVDLSELRGYQYHSGMLFAAYVPNFAGALALGGRYDEVGSKFGRARAATGFSLDLRGLLRILAVNPKKKRILAPYDANDLELQELIDALRLEGQIVVVDLPGHNQSQHELSCDRVLSKSTKGWSISDLSNVDLKK